MITLISILLFSLFLFLSSLHFYWAFGGRWGGQAVFPTKDENSKAVMPGTIPTLMVACGLLAIGFFVLIKTGQLDFHIPAILNTYGLWVVGILFIVRAIGEFNYVGFFKKIRHTRFGQNDTKYYSPLCLLLGILTLLVELLG